MADITGVLPFPAPDDANDAELAGLVAAMYAATPVADAGAAERCARAVWAESMHAPTSGRLGGLRPRWWWGAVAAALVVAVTLRPWDVSTPGGEARSPASSSAAGKADQAEPRGVVTHVPGGDAVRFDLRLPGKAHQVAIVGDFNGWDDKATPMLRRNSDDSWSAQVALAPGRHVYAFVIDGTRWLIDPLAPQVPDAGFGPSNAVMVEGANQ